VPAAHQASFHGSAPRLGLKSREVEEYIKLHQDRKNLLIHI
jgi:hypothetical protein